MPYLIGTDEAGYGPNYGPLCVSATVWEVADGVDCGGLYKLLRKVVAKKDIHVRPLPGGQCLSLIHRGPYPELGRSYERLLRVAKQREYKLLLPAREIYLKGPGMIFKGNPQKYVTEIQILYEA